jgi:tetratricopeptide (TPR) repeat protein
MINIKLYFFFLFILTAYLFGQNPQTAIENFKIQGINQMKNGRYGEAIDLLNKYISAEPKKYEGFHLRGLSYEKRDQLEMAVFDLRAARKLAPANKQVNEDLARMTKNWHAQLYQKIEGHRREIAIDPSIPINYLEIGKSYKRLGEWLKAEEWYDEYIKREDPSPDEVIRYTEILAKNNHIEKGERILKKYVERFPNDHRLWSRYGYFTLWLGKNKIAIEAFENALAKRPFFKEAIDGLDLARGKGYTYTYYDTTYYRRSKEGKLPQQQEYAIDKYYRIIRNNPEDIETRYSLIDELWKVNRIQEVSEQIDFLYNRESGKPRYEELSSRFYIVRDSIYNESIETAKLELEKDPLNVNALLKFAEMCGALQRYDEAIEAFDKYFELNKGPINPKVRYAYSQATAWNRDYPRAIEQMDLLLTEEPNNLNYQLLRGQLSAWTGLELESGQTFLENVIAARPSDLPAIISLGYIHLQKGDFEKAQEYSDLGKQFQPDDESIMQLDSDIEVRRLRAEQDRLFRLLDEGRQTIGNVGCEAALPKYEEFIAKTEPNNLVLKEYADVLACAEKYDQAIAVLTQILDQEYDSTIDLSRAKYYYWMGDSTTALGEFQRLAYNGNPTFETRLYLGDTYARMRMFKDAEAIYDSLLDSTTDSAEVSYVKQRMSWLPPSSWRGFLNSFPSYMILYPSAYYYNDNLGFKLLTYGLRGEVGVLSFLSVTFSSLRGTLKSNSLQSNHNTLTIGAIVRLSDMVVVGGSIGRNYYQTGITVPVSEYFIRVSKDTTYSVYFSNSINDAAQALTSLNLIGRGINSNIYRLNGFYNLRSGLRLSGNYALIQISDGNSGQTYDFRLGKSFYKDIIAGYEYTSTVYARPSNLYFSPGASETHAVWGDWTAHKTDEMTLIFGGRFGIIPANNFLFKTLYGQLIYKLYPTLTFQLTASYGDTVREIIGYSSRSLTAGLTWFL